MRKGVQAIKQHKSLFLRIIFAAALTAAAVIALALVIPRPDPIGAYLREIYGSNLVVCQNGAYFYEYPASSELISFGAPGELDAYVGSKFALTPAAPEFAYGEPVVLEMAGSHRGTASYDGLWTLDYFSEGAWYNLNPVLSYGSAEYSLPYGETRTFTLDASTFAQVKLFSYDPETGEYSPASDEREVPLRCGHYRYSRTVSVYENSVGTDYLLVCEFDIV